MKRTPVHMRAYECQRGGLLFWTPLYIAEHKATLYSCLADLIHLNITSEWLPSNITFPLQCPGLPEIRPNLNKVVYDEKLTENMCPRHMQLCDYTFTYISNSI